MPTARPGGTFTPSSVTQWLVFLAPANHFVTDDGVVAVLPTT